MITGRLHYLTWDMPWRVRPETDGALDLDLRDAIWTLVERFVGKGFSYEEGLHHFAMAADVPGQRPTFTNGVHDRAPMILDVGLEGRASNFILVNKDGFGFCNLGLFASLAMQRLNGRRVSVLLDDHSIQISADPEEDVPEVRFGKERGNFGAIPEDELAARCRPGKEDCCAFLVAGADGFSCAKFSGSVARTVLGRLADRTMRATRIGSCKLMGREE